MLATACLAAPAASRGTLADPVRRTWHDDKAGLTVRYPARWHLTTRNLTNITQPVPRFAIYSGATPRRVTVMGGRPRPRQVLAIVMEQTRISAAGLRQFPRRPRRFTVQRIGGVEGFGDRWAELVFRDNGRAFYVFVGVGLNGEPQLPALLHALDTLRIRR